MKNLKGQRWLRNLKERSKRMVTASLAAALLVSSCPITAYAQTVDNNLHNTDIAANAQNAPAPAETDKEHKATPRPVRHRNAANPASEAREALPDSIALGEPLKDPSEVVEKEIRLVNGHMEITPVDTVPVILGDSIMLTAGEALEADSIAAIKPKKEDEWVPRQYEFNPDPTKAVWFAALFPGLGQVYNRRYWKLPIIVGGYLGLAYATNWNSSMLTDYTKAYADLLDNDPNTKSYMDLFSPNVKEENLDKSWLRNVLRSRKNYFRRNRDLCIIAMVGVYLLAMVDAYVDASLSHFDISPDLTMDVVPAIMQDGRQRYPSVGLVWALNF